MMTPNTNEEDFAIVRSWETVRQHDEDLDIDVDQTSLSFWNRVFIVFVALNGNRNGRILASVKERFEKVFQECEDFQGNEIPKGSQSHNAKCDKMVEGSPPIRGSSWERVSTK
ncbi:uncharacterized protein LOC113362098 [Papaver somniferum]|uniref:uncharacterized protein LOC113362098 n=1 Tax=Papaver somniferum TaxID=3469 RepID=UPI000E6FF84A|nr:uncharacterized protein LOC113362098 [Papaver somniferum]